MNTNETAREQSQAIQIKNLSDQVKKLAATRDDAAQRSEYFWHLYLDQLTETAKYKTRLAERDQMAMDNELELGEHLDQLQQAAETIYLLYCGVDQDYEQFLAAEKVIVKIWAEFQQEGQDSSIAGKPAPNNMRLPF